MSLKASQAISDTLFELASSSKYLAINENINISNSAERRVYNSSDGIKIEENSHNLSISHNDKSIEFDRDFNIVKNSFSDREIHQLNAQLQNIKQQSLERNRNQRIQRDTGLSL